MRLGGLGVATVNIRGWDGSAWQKLRVEEATNPNLRAAIYDGANKVPTLTGESDGRATTTRGLVTQTFLYGFNGTSWDRLRSDPSKHLDVNMGGLANLAHGQVTIGATATMIKAANTSRKALTIKNVGAVDVYIGGSGVTTANGFKLESGEAVSDIRSTAAIYGIRATDGAGTVCFWEE